MDAGGIDSVRKALAVQVIMERIRRKVLGERRKKEAKDRIIGNTI